MYLPTVNAFLWSIIQSERWRNSKSKSVPGAGHARSTCTHITHNAIVSSASLASPAKSPAIPQGCDCCCYAYTVHIIVYDI